MKLFKLKSALENYATFVIARNSERWPDKSFNGKPRGSNYPVVRGVRDTEEMSTPLSDVLPDFTFFCHEPIPTFSERAVKALDQALLSAGELAPIEMNELMQYFAFNATTIIDILDEERSKIARFSSGRVMAVDRHELLDSVASIPFIFKIPQTSPGITYVNAAFTELVRDHALTGFDFQLLYQR